MRAILELCVNMSKYSQFLNLNRTERIYALTLIFMQIVNYFFFFQNLTCDNFSKKKKKIFLSNDGAKYLSKKNFVILKIRNLYAFRDLQVLRKLNVLKGTVNVTLLACYIHTGTS